MDQTILKLARRVRQTPGDQAAVHDLLQAMQRTTDVPSLAALLDCCASVLDGLETPDTAIAALYCHLATRANHARARALSMDALDLAPANSDALALFEKHAEPSDLNQLCDRYLAFLSEVPFHERSPSLRVALVDKLVEAGRYNEALEQVERLPPPCAITSAGCDIRRACSIAHEPPPSPSRTKSARTATDRTQPLDERELRFLTEEGAG